MYKFAGADFQDSAANNIVYTFNEYPLNTYWTNISYQYATFGPFPNGSLYVDNKLTSTTYWSSSCISGTSTPYPYFGNVNVGFHQRVRNVSFLVIGGDGGNFKVDVFQNNNSSYSHRLTIPASCGFYSACFVDLRSYTNVTGLLIHSINDHLGLGFDDFSFTLGGEEPPPPNQSPQGSFDAINGDGIASGWSRDPDNPNQANTVHFYLDGRAGAGGQHIGSAVAGEYRADVGNHAFNWRIPDQYRDGRQHQLYVYGLDLVNGNPATLLNGSPKTFTLGGNPQVQSVVFEPINNELINGEQTNSEIEFLNTGTSIESQRIFPDRRFHDDATNRKRVRVRARLGSAVQGVRVYFRNFDVDDPSDDPIIDDNGNSGNDNREGRLIGEPYPAVAAGTLSTPYADTNANGEAVVYFTVTKQPGDNFRIAASTNESYLNAITVNGTGLSDSTSSLLPTIQAKQTQLLTVWRKLYLEIDSMGRVGNNLVNGYILSKGYVGQEPLWVRVYSSTGDLEVYTNQNGNQYGRYKAIFNPGGATIFSYGGRLLLGGTYNLLVQDNTTNSVQVLSQSGQVQFFRNMIYALFDDDDFNGDDGALLNGDDGEDVDCLRTNAADVYCFGDTFRLAQPSADVTLNRFAAAYIQPEYEWARSRGFNQPDAVFQLNVPESGTDSTIDSYRNTSKLESDDFWVGYLLISYQGDVTEDYDSDFEGATGGITRSGTFADTATDSRNVTNGGDGSLLYIETMRDVDADTSDPNFRSDLRTRSLPHELGHQFGLEGDKSDQIFGVMNGPSRDRQEGNMFVPQHINVMRWRIKSPGKPARREI